MASEPREHDPEVTDTVKLIAAGDNYIQSAPSADTRDLRRLLVTRLAATLRLCCVAGVCLHELFFVEIRVFFGGLLCCVSRIHNM